MEWDGNKKQKVSMSGVQAVKGNAGNITGKQ